MDSFYGYDLRPYEVWKDAVFELLSECNELNDESKLFVKELNLRECWENEETPQDIIDRLIFRE